MNTRATAFLFLFLVLGVENAPMYLPPRPRYGRRRGHHAANKGGRVAKP